MKVTIIPADGAVYKNNIFYSGLDLSSAPENVHALQWDNNAGWIEFNSESEFRKPANQRIGVLPDWANTALEKWDEAKAAEEAAANQPQPSSQGAQTL